MSGVARQLSLSQPVNRPAAEVYTLLLDLERFPDYMPDVRRVTPLAESAFTPGSRGVREANGARRVTAWEIALGDAPLTWVQEDLAEADTLTLRFRALESVFDRAEGYWQVTPEPGGCRVRFEITYELDLPEIEAALEPILREKLAAFAQGMLTALARRALAESPYREAG